MSVHVDPLAAHLKRKVRIVAREIGPHATQLFIEAQCAQREWTPQQWDGTLRGLDTCELSVADWRAGLKAAKLDPLLG
jgi:hypothetical protein